MSITEIKSEISQLPPAELADLAEWFEELQADAWDRQIARDVKAGRFDAILQRVNEQAEKEKRMKRTVPSFALPGLLCLGLLCFSPANAKPTSHNKLTHHKKPPAPSAPDAQTSGDGDWTPDPTLLAQLSPEATVDGYALRLPVGFTEAGKVQQKIGNGTMKQHSYFGQKRKNDTAPIIIITTLSGIPVDTSSGPRPMLDKVLDDIQQMTTDGKPDLIMSERAYGQANGLPFVREYFKYSAGEGKDKFTMHGLHYASVTDTGPVLVTGLDAEPFNKTSLPLVEASALTLHKQ